MSRIITVYSRELRTTRLVEMGFIRWYRISAALARLGHQVDIASAELRRRFSGPTTAAAGTPRIVPLHRVRWSDYDVVKTLFHSGFETLRRYGGAAHPFIIAKLGSVVGPVDMEGIYFYGRTRQQLFATQEAIQRTARYVTLLTEPAVRLWHECLGPTPAVLLVPGAVDARIPPPRRNPYARDARSSCLFAGNFYKNSRSSQPEAHDTLTTKLNELGGLLDARGARLYVLGPGESRDLDGRFVTYCGVVPYEESWDYLYHAAAGIVVSAGEWMHNNESTKIYHYLRAGLPVVSEAGFPNDHVVRESGLGFVVDNGDLERMAERVIEAATRSWEREHAIDYVLRHHTWDRRAEQYDRLLRAHEQGIASPRA